VRTIEKINNKIITDCILYHTTTQIFSLMPTISTRAASLIYSAERINVLAARHWKQFAGQAYFENNGIFTSAVLSAPLVLGMTIVLINYLRALVTDLVQMKKKELIYKARQRQRAEQEGKKAR
jgi:hypothetical protein